MTQIEAKDYQVFDVVYADLNRLQSELSDIDADRGKIDWIYNAEQQEFLSTIIEGVTILEKPDFFYWLFDQRKAMTVFAQNDYEGAATGSKLPYNQRSTLMTYKIDYLTKLIAIA